MSILIAALLTMAMGAVAAIHALWGLGSTWPEVSEEALARGVVGDGRRRMPPPWQCFAVAAVLTVVALWPWVVIGRGEVGWVMAITFVIGGILVVRGMAAYSPRWRGHFADEPFVTRDRRYYGPFCVVMGIGYLSVLAREMDLQ